MAGEDAGAGTPGSWLSKLKLQAGDLAGSWGPMATDRIVSRVLQSRCAGTLWALGGGMRPDSAASCKYLRVKLEARVFSVSRPELEPPRLTSSRCDPATPFYADGGMATSLSSRLA